MRLVFVCQSLDRSDPVNASAETWVRVLADKPAVEAVTVLALRSGHFDVPANVDVRTFGSPRRGPTLLRFYREVVQALRRNPDAVFIHQGGTYPLLLLPFKVGMHLPVFQWKAHPVITRLTAFQARWCDTLVFTSTSLAFPIPLDNVRVVGQGIDCDAFRDLHLKMDGDLLTVGRVAPIKRVDQMIRAVTLANHRFGSSHRLEVVGPPHSDPAYESSLRTMVGPTDGESVVRFRGPVQHHELPAILSQHRAFMAFSDGALERSALEAMACRLPVITTNPSVASVIPEDLHPLLVVERSDTQAQGQAIDAVLSLPEGERLEIGARLRQVVETNHSVEGLFDRILAEMEKVV